MYRVLLRHLGSTKELRGLRLKLKDLQSEPFWVFRGWVERIQERLRGRKVVFIIDEFTKAEEAWKQRQIDQDFFEGLRWLVGEHQDVVFLLCVHEMIYRLLAPEEGNNGRWALLQKGQPVRLNYLDRDSAARLIRQPLGHIYQYDDSIVEYMVELTAGHPYFLQGLCRELATHMAQGNQTRVTLEDLSAAISHVLANGEHYFSHFLNEVQDDLETLVAIAWASGDNNLWLKQDQIQNLLSAPGLISAKGTMNISTLGVVDNRATQTGWEYRISIGLFQRWLRRNYSLSALVQQRRSAQ